MSKRYWTADLHLGHANIIKYCNRPTLRKGDLDDKGEWTSPEIAIIAAERQDKYLIGNCNGRVKPEDSVVHVGDFMNRGGVKGVEGLRNKQGDYIEQLNGHWTFIWGNHDKNNSVKPIARYMICEVGPYVALVSHYPVENRHMYDDRLLEYAVSCTDFQICGHIHNSWEYKYFPWGKKQYLMYNVGIDVHRYIPIDDSEVIGKVGKIFRMEQKQP